MTEPIAETTPEVPEQITETPAETQPETDWKSEAERWKSFARQHEDKAKANAEQARRNAEAARKLKEIEDRDLSELQKLQRDVEEYRARTAAAERAALRADVALQKGLPPEVVGALTGDTAEELATAADALLAWRGAAAPTQPQNPLPDKSQGAQPVSPKSAEDAEWAAFAPHVFPTHRK